MAFNKQEKLRDNIEAIRLLFDFEKSCQHPRKGDSFPLLWIWRLKMYLKSS
jgi:hypothetical protein